jgi:hypothetical protein
MNEYGIVGGMAYSDVVILETVKRLVAQHGPDAPISYAMICEASGAALNTTIRALARLKQRGDLVASYTPRRGYSYRIPNDDRSPSGHYLSGPA